MASGTINMLYVKTSTYVNESSLASNGVVQIDVVMPTDTSFANPILGTIHDPSQWYDCIVYLRKTGSGHKIFLKNDSGATHNFRGYIDILWFK